MYIFIPYLYSFNLYLFKIVYLFIFQAAGRAFKKFLPLFDRVLVERFEPQLKTKGGIMLPEKSKGKILEATVVASGPGGRSDVSCFLCKYCLKLKKTISGNFLSRLIKNLFISLSS